MIIEDRRSTQTVAGNDMNTYAADMVSLSDQIQNLRNIPRAAEPDAMQSALQITVWHVVRMNRNPETNRPK